MCQNAKDGEATRIPHPLSSSPGCPDRGGLAWMSNSPLPPSGCTPGDSEFCAMFERRRRRIRADRLYVICRQHFANSKCWLCRRMPNSHYNPFSVLSYHSKHATDIFNQVTCNISVWISKPLLQVYRKDNSCYACPYQRIRNLLPHILLSSGYELRSKSTTMPLIWQGEI